MESQSWSKKGDSKPFTIDLWTAFSEHDQCASDRFRHARSLLLVFKCILVIACFCGCSYQLWAFAEMYLGYPCSTEISTQYHQAITFPAITICNNNKIRRSKAVEIFPNLSGDNLQKAAFDEIWTQPMDYVLSMAHQHKDLVQACSSSYMNFEERNFALDICRNNRTVFSFTAMNCIVLNAHLTKKYVTVPKIRKSNYMYLVLDFEPEEYLSEKTLKGGNIKIHHPQELADCQMIGYTVKPGTVNLIRLKVTKYEMMKPPYEGKCKDYEKMETSTGLTLGTIPQLTKHMCELNCIVNIMRSTCGCMPTKMVLTKDFHFEKCTWPRNSSQDVQCMDDASPRAMGTECDDICSVSCKYDYFEFDVFENPYFSERYSEGLDIYTNTPRFKNNSQAVLVLGYQSNLVVQFQQRAKIETPKSNREDSPIFFAILNLPLEVFGYLGGYLGIWLGISLLGVLQSLGQLRKVKEVVKQPRKDTRLNCVRPAHLPKRYLRGT